MSNYTKTTKKVKETNKQTVKQATNRHKLQQIKRKKTKQTHSSVLVKLTDVKTDKQINGQAHKQTNAKSDTKKK